VNECVYVCLSGFVHTLITILLSPSKSFHIDISESSFMPARLKLIFELGIEVHNGNL
jgi:hypothetical protein